MKSCSSSLFCKLTKQLRAIHTFSGSYICKNTIFVFIKVTPRFVNKRILAYTLLLLGLILPACYTTAQNTSFTVVLDPGHGGHDSGAVGSKAKEKTINLAVALKLGELIKKGHPDVKVLYTRSTDKYIALMDRANFANRNKADLFISIHANAVKKGSTVRGTETFTLGLDRTAENMEVVKRENSVILLEDNYLEKYEGFDPNSAESYIIFEFIQNKHMEQSVSFASGIQTKFKGKNRVNRGVKQGGLLVLKQTSMPGVLVELGFISNRDEERYMSSASGQNELAQCVYDAFTAHKKDVDRKRGRASSQQAIYNEPSESYAAKEEPIREEKPIKQAAKSGQTVYKIQILTSDKKLSSNARQLKGYADAAFYMDGKVYKYTVGETTDYNAILKQFRKVNKDFKDAFIIKFKDGKRIN